MSNINKYLQNLLVSQDLKPEQGNRLQDHKKEITDFLRTKFGSSPIIKYAGSHEKGTMICDSYDLDIVCYFPSTDTRTLKEIREDVSEHLSKKYLMEDKASAERILSMKDSTSPHGYHIDVVPGRFIENTSDVFLYLAEVNKERIQTNLKTHIDYIVNSDCVQVIRLIKIWAHRNNLKIKTFVLELFVVETLKDCRTKENLETSFLKVIESMKDKFDSVKLTDPANTNNIVSQLIESHTKAIIMNSAGIAFSKINGSKDLVDWKSIFCDTSIEITTANEEKNSNNLALADYSHKEELSEQGIIDHGMYPCSVRIEAKLFFKGPRDKKINRRLKGSIKSNSLVPTWHEIDYVARTDAPVPYNIYWQVVNTGEHARHEKGLRGEIFQGGQVRTEHTLYHGMHWIECFIISKDNVCIARSGPFYVVFRNPGFLQLTTPN